MASARDDAIGPRRFVTPRSENILDWAIEMRDALCLVCSHEVYSLNRNPFPLGHVSRGRSARALRAH